MTTLILGATGATGRLLVEQLLQRGHLVKIIVRSPDTLDERIRIHEHLSVIQASILDLSDAEIASHLIGCSAIASCLGHTLNVKGIYGKPRRLVTDATRRICHAIIANKPEKPIKFVLMNTTGNSNRDLDEKISLSQKMVLGLIRLLLPPHVDNEKAADYLRIEIGQQDGVIEWTAVRPDTLINESEVTEYDVHPSPIRSALFNPGKSSRINVAHFMADLITDDTLWKKWKGRMPVIYNKETT